MYTAGQTLYKGAFDVQNPFKFDANAFNAGIGLKEQQRAHFLQKDQKWKQEEAAAEAARQEALQNDPGYMAQKGAEDKAKAEQKAIADKAYADAYSGNSGKPVTPEQKWKQGVLNQSKPSSQVDPKPVLQAPKVDTMGRPLDNNGKLTSNLSPGVPTINMGAYGGMKQQDSTISGANNAQSTIGQGGSSIDKFNKVTDAINNPDQQGQAFNPTINQLIKAGVMTKDQKGALKKFSKALGTSYDPNAPFAYADDAIGTYKNNFFGK